MSARPPSSADARRRAASVDEHATRVLARARETAAQGRDELATLRRRHAEIVGSRARLATLQWRLRLRHLLGHPVDSLLYSASLVAERPVVASVRAGLERFLYRETRLTESTRLEPAAADDRVRPLGLTRVRTMAYDAVLVSQDSTLRWRVPAVAGGAVVARAALAPPLWSSDIGDVEFVLTVADERGRERSRVVAMRPAIRWRQRRWLTLSVALWDDVEGDVEIELAIRRPSGEPGDQVVAMWGEPAVVWRRPVGAVMRSMRAAVRTYGLRGSFARLVNLRLVTPHLERYRAWRQLVEPDAEALAALALEVERWTDRPRFSIITPVRNTSPAHLRACLDSVRKQIYPDWELCLADDASDRLETLKELSAAADDPRIRLTRLDRSGHISAASNAALAMATGDYIITLDHDDLLPPHALAEVARTIRAHPDTDFLYSDEDKLDESGERCEPHFKPDWSPELFRSYMYTCHLLVCRRSLVVDVGGFRLGMEGGQDYDLALRVLERSSNVQHIPKVLYHWRKSPDSTAATPEAKPWALPKARQALKDHLVRVGAAADVENGRAPGFFRVRHRIQGNPLVSLVILAGGRRRMVEGRDIDLLAHTVRSIVQKTTYANYELVVADSGTLPEESLQVLSGVPHRRLSFPYTGAFNFSRKANLAVAEARGPYVVLLNDDLEVIASEWLTALLEFGQQPEIGAVGARLLLTDGRLQHVGMVTGVNGVATHPLHMFPASHPGYFGSAITIRNCSAVTAACMMTRRAVFDEVGGFDESLPIDFNDVDFCLRVRRRGYRIVYTPYAELYHLESSSLSGRIQSKEEIAYMQRRWAEELQRGDPYYNPNLTRHYLDYRLGSIDPPPALSMPT
jgi:GT2 family glycosyltransferase